MSEASASSFNTDTYPSLIIERVTNDRLDLVAVLLDQLQRQQAHRYHSVVLHDFAAIDLGKGALSQEIALGVLVLSVLEVLHNNYNWGERGEERFGVSRIKIIITIV